MSILQELITQSVHDMHRQKLCDLYDSQANPAGQATDIKVTRELNGWKEISFNLPRMCDGELNIRWEYIKSEALVRYTRGTSHDWFVVHAPTKSHNSLHVQTTVKCAHLSSQLNKKNLYFEFDDLNGIGTIRDLASKALAGSGWTIGACDTFFERDGTTEKVRSMKTSSKRGSYLLIQDLCKMFSAYPVFDADQKTVSIFSLNSHEGYQEQIYGKNLRSLERKEDSEDIVTRIYVEGEYGDFGYVGIDNVNPTGLSFLLDFSYYKQIGLFTQTHQDALDRYTLQIGYEKNVGQALSGAAEARDSALNVLWGQYNYVLFLISSGSITREIVGGKVSDEKRTLEAGDDVVIMLRDGTHLYATYTDNGRFGADIEEIPDVHDVEHVIKLITKPAGLIGGKEVAIESKRKSIATLWKEHDRPYNTEEKRQSIRAQIAELEEGIRLLKAGSGETEGLFSMMRRAVSLAIEIKDMRMQMDTSLDRQTQIEVEFAEAMGEMLKDGYWANSNYTVGQEQFLYEDARDMLATLCMPQVTYSVSAVNLAHISGYEKEVFDQGMTLRLYDEELGVNDHVYITKIVENPASPKDDAITISTDALDIGSKTLESILGRINEVAALIDQKNALYERARAIGRDGSIPLKLLEGTIDVMKTQLTSAVSSWHTDEFGNIVLLSLDGQAAMKLCGEGFMLASTKNEDGNWDWRTFGTGKGFTADMIVAGYLSADRIEAESITANKLASDVGRSLDLSSNESINLNVSQTVKKAVGYRVEIIADRGDVLSEYVPAVVLSAQVWNGNENITSQIAQSKFLWRRKSNDATADALWNAGHVGVKSVAVSTTDVMYSATFECAVDIEE